MKLSFSISSSKANATKPTHTFNDKSTEQNDDDDTSKHLITEFDPSKPPTQNSFPKTLIPPLQNEWKPHKKMKNLSLPITESNNDSLTFVLDTLSSQEPGSHMSYGLNLRTDKNSEPADDEPKAAPPRRVPVENIMMQKLKEDLQAMPDDQGLDEFEDVPVEGFGAALLAGYGWKEGMGIGKNAKEDVKVKEIKRRTAKEGLGFVGDAPVSIRSDYSNKKKENKDIEKKEKVVRIVRGRDAGLKGGIVKSIGDDWLLLKLSRNGEEVKVKVDDVAELGSVEEERCLRKLKDLRIERDDKDKGSKSKRRRDGVEDMRVDDGRREERRGEEKGKKRVSWLTNHIRVRVISRDLKGGRLYLKKGEVLDVVGPATCDISMDESREIIQGVSQDLLETAIPRHGGPVLVLFGKYKGAFGSLVEKDLDREIAIVRDADTHEMLSVKLEQIAEYIGDPGLLGH